MQLDVLGTCSPDMGSQRVCCDAIKMVIMMRLVFDAMFLMEGGCANQSRPSTPFVFRQVSMSTERVSELIACSHLDKSEALKIAQRL